MASRVRRRRIPSMPAFYWRLLRYTPVLLWKAGERVVTAISLGVAALTALNREWLTWTQASAAGISPAWGFLPVGLLFLYGLLRANYEAYQRIDRERGALAEKLGEVTEDRDKARAAPKMNVGVAGTAQGGGTGVMGTPGSSIIGIAGDFDDLPRPGDSERPRESPQHADEPEEEG
ncbi:MAG TPA: hypothetical protein VK988_04355 [Acidimicrobiales bacterium]|nr:hypothetical protein [Acidimicrobiales bacterium]